MSRTAIQNILLTTPGLPVGQSWSANALETPQVYPFIVQRWEGATREFGMVGTETLTVWVHDQPGDYARIDTMLSWIKSALTALVHEPGVDGRIITCVDWTGDSGDLYDDGWRTIARNAGFRVVSRAG